MSNSKIEDNHVIDIERSLRHISSIIKQKGREILTSYSITPPQFIALQWLWEEGDMTIGELSQKMYLACSTTTDLIDRMEKNHLVIRIKNPDDRRVVQIHLLKEGERMIEEVINKRQLYLKDVLNDFSIDQKKQLDSLLAKLKTEMKTE
ncbi:MarR family transcriptional regulator [Bacillus carboniphilus]|uniref:MarR family transcriptional regulator n=1 Tax=Bacillus carboniphilus TaxID=86663 RepID=A0ABY9JXK0_9BACI|nr:MarR family transcriptional regulator [Bacillus carboniphilus]WLR44121.1 MarR family transcriptional regulator [Bacillus carboniphilus]